MNLKARFSLIGLGIILFLIATPILVLYARGFKYDFKTGQITKTGTLVARTEPSKAEIYIDGKNMGQTPANVRFLLPGDYEIKLEKDGYQTWGKRLSINSQFVTWTNAFREFVTLFLSIPKQELEFTSTKFSLSKSGSEIVFEQDGSYKLLITQSGDLSNLGTSVGVSFPQIANQRFTWSNASKNFEILIAKNNLPVPDQILKNLNYAESDGERMILLSAGDLYHYDFSKITLIDNDVFAAILADDGIWYIQNNSLKHLNFNQTAPEIFAQNLPSAATAQVTRAENKVFLILDQTLYVVNDKLESIYSPVTYMHWNGVNDRLLFGNQNEIQIYDPTDKNTELILRSISPISQAKLNAETGYAFYLQENMIKVIELDGRDHRNVYTIIDDAGSEPIYEISPDGRKLYMFNSDGGKVYTIR